MSEWQPIETAPYGDMNKMLDKIAIDVARAMLIAEARLAGTKETA